MLLPDEDSNSALKGRDETFPSCCFDFEGNSWLFETFPPAALDDADDELEVFALVFAEFVAWVADDAVDEEEVAPLLDTEVEEVGRALADLLVNRVSELAVRELRPSADPLTPDVLVDIPFVPAPELVLLLLVLLGLAAPFRLASGNLIEL